MALNISDLDLSGKTVLIVEDDQPSVMYYETLLKNTGCEVFVFRTGRDFSEYVSEAGKKFDLVFMDYLVPHVNGVDCTRILRKTYRNIPVIMVTAYSSDYTKREALLAGCNEFILKPVYPDKLNEIIGKYLIEKNIIFSN
jgi:CheY-like chemotaxis protein